MKSRRKRRNQIIVHKYRVIHENLIGSPLHVKRVVMNILTNAIKYNKDNGKIIMEFQEVQEDQDTVRIQFKCKDTGIGMSESFQKKIYEPICTGKGRGKNRLRRNRAWNADYEKSCRENGRNDFI